MFFIVSRREETEPPKNKWKQMGVVEGLSLEEAAKKLGREIDEESRYPNGLYAFLKKGEDGTVYDLEQIDEITLPLNKWEAAHNQS